MLKLKTSVATSLKRKALFKGSFIAGCGMLILIAGAVFLSPKMLNDFGIYIFMVGISIVGFGMLPYKRLCKIENRPDEIIADDQGTLRYFVKGVPFLKIPFSTISQITFNEEQNPYGIGINLKNPAIEKITVLDPKINIKNHVDYSHSIYGTDLFFPYFSRISFQKLLDEYEKG